MYNKTDITHTFAFMYAAFAHLTDGEVQAEEKRVIGGKVYSWLCTFDNDVTGDGTIDGDDVIAILFDDVLQHRSVNSHLRILTTTFSSPFFKQLLKK